VDFERAVLAPRAFDVGWFIAHYRHQFAAHPRVLEACPAGEFLADYREACTGVPEGFERQVELFTARAELSIAAYLVKLGLGDSPEVGRLLAEAWEGAGRRPVGSPWDLAAAGATAARGPSSTPHGKRGGS
jgi:hypothetical protein